MSFGSIVEQLVYKDLRIWGICTNTVVRQNIIKQIQSRIDLHPKKM